MSPEKLLVEDERLELGNANAKTEAMTKVEDKSTPLISLLEIKQENSIKRDALEILHIIAYAVGHLSNDLCAAAWFTYVLYYI